MLCRVIQQLVRVLEYRPRRFQRLVIHWAIIVEARDDASGCIGCNGRLDTKVYSPLVNWLMRLGDGGLHRLLGFGNERREARNHDSEESHILLGGGGVRICLCDIDSYSEATINGMVHECRQDSAGTNNSLLGRLDLCRGVTVPLEEIL